MKLTYEKPEVNVISFQAEEPLMSSTTKPDIDGSLGGGALPFSLDEEVDE